MKNKKIMIPAVMILIIAAVLLIMIPAKNKQEPETVLPDLIKGQTFVHDELETGEGDSLYTLVFGEKEYRLYKDNGTGIIAEGYVEAKSDKSLIFENDTLTGSYTGSAFEAPYVSLTYEGKEMKFEPASDTTEYAYLSYLGVYESEINQKPAALILERWFEFYIYTDKTLIRGNYEIYENGEVVLTTLEGKEIKGEKILTNSSDEHTAAFTFDIKTDGINAKNVTFTYGTPMNEYEAAHAMGAYTLRTYQGDVFTIHGVDGLLKAMGTIEQKEDGGTAVYFPRQMTGDMELDEKFEISFQGKDDILTFPSSTYLLPRSGNIDPETGYGSYWSAGTTLEFLKQQEELTDEQYQTIRNEIENTEKSENLTVNLPDDNRLLKQSMPSVGTAKPLVLLIDFPDYHRPRFVTAEAMEEALFSLDRKDSLSAFYYVSSFGNLTIDGTVLDWYRAEKNRDEYESDKEIMAEAVNYYIDTEGLNLADYDSDGDGEVDSLYVLWAGNLTQDDGMWSVAYRSTWSASPAEWERSVRGYIFVPGNTVWSSVPPLTCNLNSLTHETGHLLGLNDYYSYDTTDREDDSEAYTGGALEGGIGGMDMMDANIGDHNAFSKWLLGWIEPEVIEYEDIKTLDLEENVYTLHPSNEEGDAIFVKLKSEDSLYTEMLVIEIVSATRNANELTRLKEPVVRILHVEASLDDPDTTGNWRAYGFQYDNSYTSTKFISLIEADGKDQSLNHVPGTNGSKISYDMEDYFTEGMKLTPNTYPNTNGYDSCGNATVYNGLVIQIESIDENGEAVIRLGYEEEKETLRVEKITPEPVVVPYASDEVKKMSVETKEIVVTFDREIMLTEKQNESPICVYSGNEEYTEFEISTEGKNLILRFKQSLEENEDYTVVIPAGVLCAADDKEVTNQYNSIFGFLTK